MFFYYLAAAERPQHCALVYPVSKFKVVYSWLPVFGNLFWCSGAVVLLLVALTSYLYNILLILIIIMEFFHEKAVLMFPSNAKNRRQHVDT